MTNEKVIYDFLEGNTVNTDTLKEVITGVLGELNIYKNALRIGSLNKNRYAGKINYTYDRDIICPCGEVLPHSGSLKVPWSVIKDTLQMVNLYVEEDMNKKS